MKYTKLQDCKEYLLILFTFAIHIIFQEPYGPLLLLGIQTDKFYLFHIIISLIIWNCNKIIQGL